MPYIAFIDMVGTRSSAKISNAEYTSAINDFNKALEQLSNRYNCAVYGYSDNAYIQVDRLEDMIEFFQNLRKILMMNHRYFTAAIDCGSLDTKVVELKTGGYLQKFTASKTINIYMAQSQLKGIGVSLSQTVVDKINECNLEKKYCKSVFKPYLNKEKTTNICEFYDLVYKNVTLEQLEYIIADYLITASINCNAGRYYLTPAISMIKSLNIKILERNLSRLNQVLSFKNVPEAFRSLYSVDEYMILFMFALVDTVFEKQSEELLFDSSKACEQIIREYKVCFSRLIEELPSVPEAVISNKHKRKFLEVLYNIREQNNKFEERN